MKKKYLKILLIQYVLSNLKLKMIIQKKNKYYYLSIKKKIETILNNDNNYLIGGDIYKLKLNNKYKISRLTKKCIDDNKDNKISLSLVDDDNIYIDTTPNLSSRTYATLVINPIINKKKQKKLVKKFNEYLNNHREKYNSLFLTNYRESKDISRKRISFDLVYSIVQYILENF